MKIKPVFKWYDFWIGFYWSPRFKKLYIMLLPGLGFMIDFRKEK